MQKGRNFNPFALKVTKTKGGGFTSDQALLKLIYLAIQNISKK